MFNIRVYGVLIENRTYVLLSDEVIQGNFYTKFPGGGLEEGEGTKDCLRREFKEELGIDIAVKDHIYTTDFYQKSAFGKGDQVISIYYFVEALQPLPDRVVYSNAPLFEENQREEKFRLTNLQTFSAECVNLPIDKIVANQLLASLAMEEPRH